MKKAILFTLPLSLIFAGCSTLTGDGTGQNVSVETFDKTSGDKVLEATCELKNDEGAWLVKTPATTMVHRSNKDLAVNCSKSGYEPQLMNIVSKTKGNMFGNILFGGGIGAIIDHNNGSAYDYPALIRIPMSKK